MSGVLSLTGTNTTSTGQTVINESIPMGNVDEVLDLSLVMGDNVVTIPAGSNGCVVVPPQSNTGPSAVALKTKNQAGDSGEPRSGFMPWMHTFPSSTPASFIINASAVLAGVVVRFF